MTLSYCWLFFLSNLHSSVCVVGTEGDSLGGEWAIPRMVADTSAVGGVNRTFEIFLEFSAATHMDIVTLFFFFFF